MSADSHLIAEIENALDSAKTSYDLRFEWAERSIDSISSEEERKRLRDKQQEIERRIGTGRPLVQAC